MENRRQGSSGIGLEGFYTSQIQNELSSRLGVTTFGAPTPDDHLKIIINGEVVIDSTGPALVTVNID